MAWKNGNDPQEKSFFKNGLILLNEILFSRPYYPESMKIGWKRNRKNMYSIWTSSWHSPTFLYNRYLVSLPNENFFTENNSPLFFSKEKNPNDGWVDLESRGLKLGIPGHFTASSSQALILKRHEKTSRPLGKTRARLMIFDESVARGRYPLPKKTYISIATCQGGPSKPNKDSLIFTYQGVFQVRRVRFGEGFFCSFKKL